MCETDAIQKVIKKIYGNDYMILNEDANQLKEGYKK